MAAGLRAVWRGLRHVNQQGYVYIWSNVLWALLSLPVVTAPAAWAGLVKVSHAAHTRPTAEISLFWEGFREHFRHGLVLLVLNVVILVVNISNIASYSRQPGLLWDIGRLVWVLTLIVWFTVQLYLWPLYYEMKQPTLLGALRNAAVMMYLNPLFSLVVLACAALIAFLSTVFFASWVLISGSALAAVGTSAVLDRLEAAGLRQRMAGTDKEVVSASEWE